jgi:hypothetical protein
MKARSAGKLLNLPVCQHGIVLGRTIDLTVDLESGRVVGFVVRCRDGADRFLPLPAARVGDGEIQVGSALLLLDDLDYYLARGRSFKALVAEDGRLAGLVVDPEGRVELDVVDRSRHARK